jgi:lipoyl(octanoyl) transferase
MQAFTNSRGDETPDEIWFTEHPPVFTLGLNASREHVLAPGEIPVIQIDRGGQVTYHGPGQLMIYPLVDLRRAGLGVRNFVTALEQSVVDLAAQYNIVAASRADAPLRVRRNSSYHGMALNVDMDLEPFTRINPCGFEDLEVTDLAALGVTKDLSEVARDLEPHLLRHLGF